MKLNWGFGIATVYILFAGCMIFLAIKASQQHYDLVSQNYYDDAVKYQQKIDAGKNALLLTSKLSIEYLPEKKAVEISSTEKIKNIKGTLFFYKPDKAGDDFQIPFSTGNEGRELITLKQMAHGTWKIYVSWIAEGKDCYAEKKIFVK